MIRILDYYYLVLLRGYGRALDYRATGMMTLTFVVNISSLVILFDPAFFFEYAFWINFFISHIVIYFILNRRYKKEQREEIIRKHKKESRESRQDGVFKVVFYEILSFVFLIWTLSRIDISGSNTIWY